MKTLITKFEIDSSTPQNISTSFEKGQIQGLSFDNPKAYGEQLLQDLAEATDERDNEWMLVLKIKALKQRMGLGLPLTMRHEFFVKTNDLMSHAYLTFPHNQPLYTAFLNLTTEINNELNTTVAANDSQSDAEWEELMRSAFVITEWESELGCDKPFEGLQIMNDSLN